MSGTIHPSCHRRRKSQQCGMLSGCFPRALEIFALVKDEILKSNHFSSFRIDYRYATIFDHPSTAIGLFHIPMYDCDVGSKTKDALDIDAFNNELNTRHLVEPLSEPAFDSGFPIKSAA